MTVSQTSYQTIDGSQLKIVFSADFEGVAPEDITSITATFYDSAGVELFQYDVTDVNEVTIAMTKDQSIKSVITYATATNEYEGIAHICCTRFAVKKRSDLIEHNAKYRTSRVSTIIATMQSLIDDAVFTHATGERVMFDQDIADINKQLDYYLPC